MIYFSSDLHFNHNKDFIYAARGFSTIEEMNLKIITNFNSIVKPKDDLYLLGDIMLGDLESSINLFNYLNGNIHLVWGNHDTQKRQKAMSGCPNVVEIIGYAGILKYNKYHFYLSHYPTITSNHDDDKPLKMQQLCLSGHTHSTSIFDYGAYNVAVDAHSCYPVSINQIIEDFKNHLAKNN